MRYWRPISGALVVLSSATLSFAASALHPVEQRLREQFPSAVARAVAPAETTEPVLRVTHPSFYGDPLVASLGQQRVVLRALNARSAIAEPADGKLIYQQPYESVDAVEVPLGGRSEELLLLRNKNAPLVFEYAIVEMRGVAAVVIDGGAVRFLPEAADIPAAPQIEGGRFVNTPRTLQIDRPWVIDALGRRDETHAVWTLHNQKTLRLTVNARGLSYPLLVDPSFSATGNLATPRGQHTATLLTNGKVLFAGGNSNGEFLSSAETYDPAKGTFTTSGNLATGRQLHTATQLLNGKVLIAGGMNGSSLSSAEIYDPVSDTFTATGSLGTARYGHTATLLANGMVLIAGGQGSTAPVASSELYDPASGTFSNSGSLTAARYFHTATLLGNGRVLVAGGFNAGALASAEVYDPATGLFSGTADLVTARYSHTATRLASGWVLIAGGFGSTTLASTELYDPAGAGLFSSAGNLGAARSQHMASLLPNGKVLIAGGAQGAAALSSADLYDPAGSISATGGLATARFYATATLLPGGSVLVAGGQAGAGVYVSSAERFDPATSGTAAATGNMSEARLGFTATLLPDGRVLAVGGSSSSADIYNSANGLFSATAPLNNGRYSHTATLLPSGKVLIVGGASLAALTSAELFDPAGPAFTATGSLGAARYQHTATLLPNGKVLIAGGLNGVSLSSAEIYDLGSGTFSPTGNLNTARDKHTATLLPNGKVLIAGGENTAGFPMTSAELYDPLTGVFTTTGSLGTARFGHTATLLPSGKVLIAGAPGNDPPPLISAELYDPTAGTFSGTGNLIMGTGAQAATLLPNGKVLLSGGYTAQTENNTVFCELYDPLTGSFSAGGNLLAARAASLATLLLNGKVLVAGGFGDQLLAPFPLASAELFDAGLGYADARRPVITSAPATLIQPATITITGTRFRGDSEGSGGASNNSATNIPVLQLQRIDNDQTVFVRADSWSDSSFVSTVVSGLPNGHYRLTVITGAVPSLQSIILITGAPTITAINPNGGPASGGQSVTITGTNLNGASVVIGGNAAAATSTASTVTFLTPPHATGAVDVTVTTLGGSVTSMLGYTYFPLSTPAAFAAIANSNSQVGLSWAAATGATSYEVWRSSLNGAYTLAVSTAATSASDAGLTADRTYLYKVRALGMAGSSAFSPIDPATTIIFTDASLAAVQIQTVHVTQLRTAVNAMRVAAGLPTITFTDPLLTAGSTTIRRLHLTELRAALDEARTTLALPPIAYADPTITAGSTVVKAAHLTELRSGTQ